MVAWWKAYKLHITYVDMNFRRWMKFNTWIKHKIICRNTLSSYLAKNVSKLGGLLSYEKRNWYKIKWKYVNHIEKLFMNISIIQMCLKNNRESTYFNFGVNLYPNLLPFSPDRYLVKTCCIMYVFKQVSVKTTWWNQGTQMKKWK